MPTRHYDLGPVKPWVQAAGDYLGGQFNIVTEYGFAGGHDQDHSLGLAVDFMVYSDTSKGDELATYAEAAYKELDIYYIIWQQRIWDSHRDPLGEPHDQWRLMPDRGSPTANHMDHVHISFNSTPPGSGSFINPTPEPKWEQKLGQAPNLGLGGLEGIYSWVTNGHNWLRVLMVLAGAGLIAFALSKFGVGGDTVTQGVSTVTGVIGKVK